MPPREQQKADRHMGKAALEANLLLVQHTNSVVTLSKAHFSKHFIHEESDAIWDLIESELGFVISKAELLRYSHNDIIISTHPCGMSIVEERNALYV